MDMMIVLMQTDLPEPVVPAIRQCGIAARSVISGSPLASLPRYSGMACLVVGLGRELHQLLEAHLFLLRVGDFDADRVLPGHRRDDAHALGLQRAHDVVAQRRDGRDLDARRQADLVHRDDRAGVDLDDAGVDVEFLERLLEHGGHLADERLLALGEPVLGFFEEVPVGQVILAQFLRRGRRRGDLPRLQEARAASR